MKKWNFKVESNVQNVMKKLEVTLGSADGFVFNIAKGDKDSVKFKLHKRGLYAFYLYFFNKLIVNGRIFKTNIENEASIEISFKQYFLWKFLIVTHFVVALGFLIAVILNVGGSAVMYLFAGIILAIGIVLGITVRRKFKKDVQEYKTLISGILLS